MKLPIISYFVSLITFLILDGLWLGIFMKKFYAKYLGHLLAPNPKLIPALLFYLIYILGITVFIILPGFKNNLSLKQVFSLGALLGLVAYSTYDLTNLATLKNWPYLVTIIDIGWGTLITGLGSIITFTIIKMYFK